MIRSLLVAGLFTALTFSAGQAVAQEGDAEVQAARESFAHGVELYQAQDYTGALAAFQEAYRLRPHPIVRVNMANCYDHLGRPVEAIFHFERFLSESGRNAQPQQRREVETALVALRQRVAAVTLRIAPDGATVRIDDAEERRAPLLEPITLTAGTHRIAVSLNGYRTETRTIEVAGGRAQDVAVRLERGSAADTAIVANPNPGNAQPGVQQGQAAQTPSETTNPELVVADNGETTSNDSGGGLHLTSTTLIVGGVSAGVVVVACITGALASSANSSFDENVARANDPSLSDAARNAAIRDGRDDASRANTLATVTDVLGIAGAIGLGVAVTMFFLSGNEDEDPSQNQARIVATPTFSHESAGVMVRGSF